jgi:hypothetical protein
MVFLLPLLFESDYESRFGSSFFFWPIMTIFSDIHRCCARGFFGNSTTFQCPSSSFRDPSFPVA